MKSFGKAEPDLELIYIPTDPELVREHTFVVLRHQKRNKGEAFWSSIWKDSSADRGHGHFLPVILTCTSFPWLSCVSEMRVLSISYSPPSPAQELKLEPCDFPVTWHGSDLAVSPAVISQGEPDVIDLLLMGVWLSPHTDPSQDIPHNFIPFLKSAFKEPKPAVSTCLKGCIEKPVWHGVKCGKQINCTET